MKRCPQCEFIYEDDQSLCDMDGVLLVLDSRTLPNLHALATVPATKAAPRRNRAVPAFATVTLALVLGMVYYVSTQRHTPRSIEIPANAATASNPAPEVNPTPQAQASEAVPVPVVEEPQPAPAKQPAVVPAKKSLPAKGAATATTSKTSSEPKKEENKVGSILKKTGRLLKKPFKL